MCDVVTALKIGTAIVSHRNQRAIAKGQQEANELTRKNSDQAYLNDLSKIDGEYVTTSREKKAEEFRLNQEKNKKQAKLLNMNAGNGDKIIQDIAGTHDMQFLDVARDYETDVIKLMGQEQEAYAAQQRRYNSIKPVVMPSRTGLLLNIGTIGAEGYQKYKTNLKPDTGEVVAP